MAASPGPPELYEDAACGLLLTQADGSILRANRTFCHWIGREAGELQGQRLQSLLSIGGRIFHQTHWAPLLQMQGSLAEVKLELLHADGRKLPMVMNAVVRRHAGQEFHELAVFSARDRHQYERELLIARQRAEELLRRGQEGQRELAEARVRLELALDAAHLSQWSLDLADGLRRYAPEVALLLGHPLPQPVDAALFVEHMHPDDRVREAAELAAFVAAGGERLHTLFRLRGVDGVERWIAAWGRLRQGASGAPAVFIGLLQDVTEAQRQRAVAEDRALLAEQTLGIVGHDLRNPLFAIQMSADLLARGSLSAELQQGVVARIQSSTRRAKRLIADLLDFTQARNGWALPVSKTAVEVHAITREAVNELSVAHKTDRLRHDFDGDGRALADADRLAQAIGNLVSNAVHYGRAGGWVTVTSAGLAGAVEIRVHNEGAPIDPQLLPRIFEPMTRGTDAGDQRSVGLGLFIVREIAMAHGGTAECRSGADGTVFTLRLPR